MQPSFGVLRRLIVTSIALPPVVFSAILPFDLPNFSDGFLSPQYVAVFSEEKPHDIAAEARIYPVTAPDGSRFTCLLPSVDQTAPIQSHDTSLPEGLPDPVELLKPLEGPPPKCFRRKDGRWTYEVCHGSKVRQVREDSEGNVLEEILLGQAGSEGVPHGIIEPAKGSSRHDSGSILSFEMSGGSVCEATGRPRTVKAQWSCGRGVTALKGVREEGMCEYEVDLTSELLCDDPRLSPPDVPLYRILCYPEESRGEGGDAEDANEDGV